MAGKSRKRVRLNLEKRKRKRRGYFLVLVCLFIIGVLAASIWLVEQIRTPRQPVLSSIHVPDWVDQEFIRANPYSRPGIPLARVNGIVIHYVANPNTSALQNRKYFDGLADQNTDQPISVSSHFIIGLDGEVIQCIPLDEIAYASNSRNVDTIAIECCHPDWSGEFTPATYNSLVELTAWLCNELNLKEKHIIRHYDITGKNCPKYFVENEKAWKQLKQNIKQKRKLKIGQGM